VPEVGVRELKARVSDILREVREKRTRYTITYRGQAIGMLVPIGEAREETAEEVWERLVNLGEEIGKGWRSPLSSHELLSEMRR
jgi:prevent-host-death family protein